MNNFNIFLSNNKKYQFEIADSGIYIEQIKGGDIMYIPLPDGRSLRGQLLALTEDHVAKELATIGDYIFTTSSTTELTKEIIALKSDFLAWELRHNLYPFFSRTIETGADLGDYPFVYRGKVVVGGEATHLHNLMIGLQNLIGHADNEGLYSHRAMMSFVEKEDRVAYWQRYATRALIAYSKTVTGLYIEGINELALDELRLVYVTLHRAEWEQDQIKAQKRAREEARKKCFHF